MGDLGIKTFLSGIILIEIFSAKNYMSYDLGLNHEAEDDKYIKNAIQELESTYHLVLLTDYFEESLILLKVRLILNFEFNLF